VDALPRDPAAAGPGLPDLRAGPRFRRLRGHRPGLRGGLGRLRGRAAGARLGARVDLHAEHGIAVDAAVAQATCLAVTGYHADHVLDVDMQHALAALRTGTLDGHAVLLGQACFDEG